LTAGCDSTATSLQPTHPPPPLPPQPDQAAYKNPIPFLRPKADSQFDGTMFNMMGSPYAMQEQVRALGAHWGTEAVGGLGRVAGDTRTTLPNHPHTQTPKHNPTHPPT